MTTQSVEVPGYYFGKDEDRIAIKPDEYVECKPLVGGKFIGRVRKIKARDGKVVEVEVYGGDPGYECIRTFVPKRITPIKMNTEGKRKVAAADASALATKAGVSKPRRKAGTK